MVWVLVLAAPNGCLLKITSTTFCVSGKTNRVEWEKNRKKIINLPRWYLKKEFSKAGRHVVIEWIYIY
jgi:hypothetical protein